MNIPTKNSRIKALGFSKNDTIIIAGDYCCEVYSTTTGLSSVLSDDNDGTTVDSIFDMTISVDNKKLALAKAKKIVLYDITGDIKKEEELHYGWGHQISFVNDSLNICYEKSFPHIMCSYHCITKELFQRRHDPCSIAGPLYVTGDRHSIIITDLGNMRERERERMGNFQFHLLPLTYSERFPSGEFNYDGTFLAINMSGEKYRFSPLVKQNIDEFEISSKEKRENENIFYIAIAFHKNNVTAALLRNDGAVEFWDYRKKQLLEILCDDITDEKMLWKDRNNRDQLLCFSPDCESIVASVRSKINWCSVPRTAICVQGADRSCVRRLFFLNSYDDMAIPRDVIWKIIDNFLWCSELVHEEKMCKIVLKYRSEIIARVLANQEKMSDEKDNVDENEEDQKIVLDEEKDDFYTCTCQMRKTYVKALAVLAGIAAVCAMVKF